MQSDGRRFAGGAAALVVVAAIGWLDYLTGVDIGLSLFYLVPIVVSAWFCGARISAAVAFAAATVWLAADVSLRGGDASLYVSFWNGFTRYVIYISEAIFIALLRSDRELLRHVAERESSLARTDLATRLPNARAFMEVLAAELERARAAGDALCVLYIDLDNFKSVNDTFGHATGDLVLQQVAEELLHVMRPGEVAARLGGDEFAMLLCGLDEVSAERVARRILIRITDLAASYPGSDLNATIGIAYFERSLPGDAEELLRVADASMYSGKREGKGRIVRLPQREDVALRDAPEQ